MTDQQLCTPTVGQVVALVDGLYPPRLAESWDSVGLICGDVDAPVRRVLVALDPVEAIAAEAVEGGVDLVLTHHPLFLRGTHSVATDSTKGRVVHMLIRSGCALMNAHTNADAQTGGVADTLADLVGMADDRRPLLPCEDDPHVGIGRVGELREPVSLRDFAARLARVLPATPAGVTWGGHPQRLIRRVAVSPGAGDSLVDDVRQAGVDCYVCADMRHHPASEFLEEPGPALVTGSHYATEWPWVIPASQQVARAAHDAGYALDVHYSSRVTEPWNGHFSTEEDQQ